MARILVIEDDEHLQTAVRDVLSDVGHVVFVANNGREGVSRYREHHPDLVITDIFMPERNGLDVILELAPTNVSIIAMSGGGRLDRGDHLDDALQFGASRVLVKPFTLDALIAAVNAALRQCKSGGEHPGGKENVNARGVLSPPNVSGSTPAA
jgi:two-component system, chemotaxis family, chemotaxis protein CheY